MLALFDRLVEAGFQPSLRHQDGRYWVDVETWADAERMGKLAELTKDFPNTAGNAKISILP